MPYIQWHYLQWPWVTQTAPNHPFRHFVYPLISSLRAEIETSNLVGRLMVASSRRAIGKLSLKGAWSGHTNHLYFGGHQCTNLVSGTAAARVVTSIDRLWCCQLRWVVSVINWWLITCRYCTKTAKRRIMQTTPYFSPWTVVFCCHQRSRQNSNGAAEQRWDKYTSAIFDQYLAVTYVRNRAR